ncbi:MAG TPA: NADP-dependent oxidoreductase [Actinomycetes bacterium]|nr:NADP-dependent oxidoreductase [Actinomycetes bacterium]
MTLAVVATAYGGPDVLDLVEVEVGDPGPGEVVVDVRAAGVNPADVKSYSGAWGNDPAALPKRLGFEAAGVVSAVGPDALGPAGPIRVGDEVIAYPVAGAYAQRLIVQASSVLPKPSTMAWEPAAGLLLAGVAAAHTVVATGVSDGETVLVHGGAGGVGLTVVQLAIARGARVVATARPADHDLLRSLGAEPITYDGGLLERVRAIGPVDAAIDTVGTDEAIDVSLAVVPDPHRIASLVAFGRAKDGIQTLGAGGDKGEDIRDAARLDLVRTAAAGKLTVIVARTYPLEQVRRAHEELFEPHGPGKFVLLP